MVEDGAEPSELNSYVLEALKAREDLGNLTILDKDALIADTLERYGGKAAEPAPEGSAAAALVEAGAEGLTPELAAALIQEKWIELMEADLEAKKTAGSAGPSPDVAEVTRVGPSKC